MCPLYEMPKERERALPRLRGERDDTTRDVEDIHGVARPGVIRTNDGANSTVNTMMPVIQTRLYDPTNQSPPGNCWAACLASILGVPIYFLPDEKDWWEPGMSPAKSWPPYCRATIEWLRERGLTFLECKVSGIELDELGPTYCVLSGPSPRDQFITHSVVGINDKIVHDPHPSGEGLIGELKDWRVGFLVRTGSCSAID